MRGKLGRCVLVALIVLAFALTACSVDSGGTATPDLTKYDKAREGTLNTLIDMRATRDAKKEGK